MLSVHVFQSLTGNKHADMSITFNTLGLFSYLLVPFENLEAVYSQFL